MAREISAIKSRPQSSGAVVVSTKPVSGTLMEGQMYVFMGCPRDVAINVVYFVTAAVEPTNTHIISFNQSESAVIQGRHVLLESTLPPFPVFCTIDKFIVVQRRRAPFDLPFNRTWNDYKNGFGDVSGEFWLGLEKLYRITNQPYLKYSIRLEMKLTSGVLHYLEYNDFYIGDEKERYKIANIGTATAKTVSYYIYKGHTFFTRDKDTSRKLGATYNGFWYHPTSTSYNYVLLNRNVPSWTGISGSVAYTEIKIRPIEV
ncbi:Angiopoietin-1 [Lamellibrachia satsuma]|nr:Angiopoietin-1 [Lamellibrachia satsuma]